MHPMSENLREAAAYFDGINSVESGKRMREAAAELDRLAALEARLPRTADGVPIHPGLIVYTLDDLDNPTLVSAVTNFNACGCDGDGEESYAGVQDDCHKDCERHHPSSECYSTREAAESAHAAKEADDAIQ